MLDKLLHTLEKDDSRWEKVRTFFHRKSIPPKTTLLEEGEIARYVYFIKKGCLRMWFNNDGKDVTLQFFFENQAVASIESFRRQRPSLFTLESIEETKITCISKEDFDKLFGLFPELKAGFLEIALERMSNYADLFLSRIKDNPRKRYEELLREHPEIIQRVPQHYIASYLGITPISLSRIRNRK
jgi:CRP-like cAMP-binding protein